MWIATAVRVGLPVTLTVILFVATVTFYMMPTLEKTMMADRKRLLRELTNTALEMLTTYENRIRNGELTAVQAHRRARNSLRQWRYGEDRKEYFWIMEIRADGHPYTIMQPYFPEHTGLDQYNLRDKNGKYFAREIVDVIRANGEGFVTYDWQWKDDPTRIVAKVSYVREFKPWKWIVGTGIYLDDMQVEFNKITDMLKRVFGAVLAVVGLLSLYIIWQGGRSEKLRKSAENARLESESRFRTLVENASDAIFLINFKGDVLAANQTACRCLQYSTDELGAKTIGDLCGRHHAQALSSAVAQLTEAVPVSVESKHYRKDGSCYPVDVRLSLIEIESKRQVLMVSRDITEKKRAEEALKASEEKYRTVVDASLSGIFIVQDGNFVYANPRFAQISGYERPEEVVGRCIEEFIHPDHRDEILNRYHGHIVEDTKQPNQYTFKGIRADGVEIWLETLVTEVRYQGKKALVGNIIDISARKRMEDQLRQAQKMEAIGTLAGGIAHDFNNILTAIIGYTFLSLGELPTDSEARPKLENVLKAGQRAQDLVSHILAFSRQTHYEQKPIQLHPLIKETVKLLRASIPTTIDIRQDIDPKAGPVLANPTQIHQILMNLCTNAYHAMGEKGGLLNIVLKEVQILPQDAGRQLKLEAGRHIRLSVSDTGVGIEKANLNRIFEPYFTTKQKSEGTGMGLSVVHGIVESLSGRITVYSEPGQGTCFNVYFPVAGQPAAEDKLIEIQLPTGTEHILVVDDESDIALLLKQILERQGYRVTDTTSSETALDLFIRRPDDFDAVITDMTMPGMTGKELASRLLTIRDDLPVIMCTGFSDHINATTAESIGCRAFVMKPIMVGALSKTLRDVLDGNPRPFAAAVG